MRILVGAFIAVAASMGAAAQSPALTPAAPDYAPGEFEKTVAAAYATGDFVGLAVAVVRDGETELLRTYGRRDVGFDAPVTVDTVFRVASLSKGFAASLAAGAMLEGRLSAGDPATGFAPELKLAGAGEKKLTLGHLLSHRTGLPPNAYDNLLEEGTAPDAILPKYREVKLVCAVGSCYAYQNIAFNLVGRALSSAYGESFGDLAETRLFQPLAMRTASVGSAGLVETGDFARPHKRERVKGGDYGPWQAAPIKDAYYKVPAAGGVNASILDMSSWLKAQMGARPEVLAPDLLAILHAPQIATPPETRRMRPVSTRFLTSAYGYGWRIYDYAGRKVISHSGTVDGYGALIAFLPEERVGVVLLSNSRSKRLWRLLPAFLDIELGLSREDWLALGDATLAKAGGK